MLEAIGAAVMMIMGAIVGWVMKVEKKLAAHDEALKTIASVEKKVDKLDDRLAELTDYLLAKNGPR